MPPNADTPMLDEIILALQAGADDVAAATVLELTADDLIADGSEIVDLANILGQGGELGENLAGTQVELVFVESRNSEAAPSTDTTGPGNQSDVASILYKILSLSSDDSTSN